MPGAFIVLEGPDGAGKTTQARRLVEALERAGRRPVAVREPGYTEIGEKVRAILLDPANESLDPRAELLLYMAARAQLCREVIAPALREGRVVVADRFLASSVVYQGAALGLGVDDVAAIGRFAVGDVRADLTILLDLPVDLAIERGAARGGAPDRIERRPREYYERVCEAYRAWPGLDGERVVTIDAARAEDEVARDVRAHVEALLEAKRA